MIRFTLVIILILLVPVTDALESVALQAGAINAKGWKLEGIRIALSDLSANPQKLALSVAKLELPKPFNDLSLVDIQCPSFSWQNKELLCQQGKGKFRSKQWLSPAFNFSFQFQESRNRLKITDFSLAGARFDIDVEETGHQWNLQINARNVDHKLIEEVVKTGRLKLQEAQLDFRLNARGSHEQVQHFIVEAELAKLTIQTESGQFATEKLALDSHVEAQYQSGLWHWQNQTKLKEGALYVEPVYLEAGHHDINLEARGNWDSTKQRAEISSARYQHSLAADVSGTASIAFDKGVQAEKAAISLHSKDLQTLSAIYLKPFFTQTPLENVALAGEIKADFSIVQQSLTALAASFSKLAIHDEAGRIQMQGGSGVINWANNEAFATPSELAWQQLNLRALPLGPSRLTFLSKTKSIKLLKKATLPFLGGAIDIHQFSWLAKDRDEPDVTFEGKLLDASLAQLSAALDWTPLSGTVSSVIPKVEYHNKTLTLDGQMIVNIFGGKLVFSKLASSGLFTNFPKLQGDIEVENLDLAQLTGKFNFGSITGKLSGFVRQLYLENWKPVTFYAWLGTPDDDDSSHRISQRAVNNIASIGGNGASDLLSRTFLGVFETFGYSKLGLGCYLHDGVCQLMGVKATKSGYAMITGGGLPRIDVIGYNPQVDWNVLLDRLSRITASDKVIVK